MPLRGSLQVLQEVKVIASEQSQVYYADERAGGPEYDKDRNMTEAVSARRMILCAGLQSGGTTLISWCFLQRRDTNGVLDMSGDMIQPSFEKVKEPILWAKQTVASFQWLDMYETYCDLGWEPEPLLVVRDVRAAYSSLIKKPYGINGTTAEDPPLRMRFRRFLRDWELFRAHGWPIIKFEDFVQEPRAILMKICMDLSLPWDEGMVSWPKRSSEIAYFKEGGAVCSRHNKTFEGSFEKSHLAAATLRDRAEIRIDGLPRSELEWLEETFSAYNSFHRYPEEVRPRLQEERHTIPTSMAAPRYEGTGREWYYSEMERLRSEYWRLISENERLREKSKA
jgi:hypothetical protein